jgi:hypothetical protein
MKTNFDMLELKACQVCRFWQQTSGTDGHCRRRSPRASRDGNYARWPITKADDWCGEIRVKGSASQRS